ncbi:hypothetical protein GCM10022258_29810 [Aquimarina gracilis]
MDLGPRLEFHIPSKTYFIIELITSKNGSYISNKEPFFYNHIAQSEQFNISF